MKPILTILILLSAIADTTAQYNTNRNKVWAFGKKAGLDFSSGSPVPFVSGIDTNIYTEGCASVSDTAGHLLFYTDGMRVYNRNHTLMPAGSAVVPFTTLSATQAALIVPVIGNSSRYYLFSLQEGGSGPTASHLAYCIVDMALDGGYGDVVASSAGTPLQDSLGEKMIAIPGSNHNIWLIVHRVDTAIFLAYEINSSGIDTVPVVSAVGSFHGTLCYAAGVIKASPNWQKIVSQNALNLPANQSCTELYDFNPATGSVSNCIVLDTMKGQYGAEFSPDNTKLYTSHSRTYDTTEVYQYNLALTGTAAIIASKTLLQITIHGSDLKLGPDNKIYTRGTDDSTLTHSLKYSRWLDCITSPNVAGAACGYTTHAIKFSDTTGIFYGLPSVVVSPNATTGIGEANESHSDIIIFPNPATTELFISSPTIINHVSIYNTVGQEVFNHEYGSEQAKADISYLPAGMYLVRVNVVEVRTFIKPQM